MIGEATTEADKVSSENMILGPGDLLARMRQGIKETYMIHLRGYEIPVRVLSCSEVSQIRNAALRDQKVTGVDDAEKNLSVMKMTLERSSTPQGSAPALPRKVIDLLSIDELNYLYDEYIRVMEELNPSIEHIEPERFQAFVDALKKNSISEKGLSMPVLRAICRAYVALILELENRS